MSWRRLANWGFLLLLAALVAGVIAHNNRQVTDDPLDRYSDWLLTGGGALLIAAALMYVLEKAGMRVAGARCADCRKSIQHGHLYCYDHLRDRTNAAREKYHDQRGKGF